MTKNRIIAVIAGTLMVMSTGAVFATHVQDAHPRRNRVERHPEINHAIKALQNAKKFLQKADRDFGGHRTKAVEAVDQALSECQQAIQYDQH